MEKQPLHLDLIPLDLAWGDPTENLRRMEHAIADRLGMRRELLPAERLFVFPEVTLTAFVTEKSALTSFSRYAPEVEAARVLAKKNGIGLVFGFPELVPGQEKPFNTALLVSPEGKDLAAYQKQHLFTLGQNPESATFARGLCGNLVSYRGWKIGFGICFDLRFPAMFQAYARARADLLLLPACWLGGPGKSYQLQTLSAARAIETQAYFAALNRSGRDPYATYEGEALCYGPKGEPLADQSGFDLDPTLVAEARRLEVRASDRSDYPVTS